jgi:surfeit locus 1 family protein
MRPLIVTALLFVFVPVFIAAGFWQLDRADEKATLLATAKASREASVLIWPVAEPQAAHYRYRRVQVSGRFITRQQVLLDSMTTGGMSGYEVLTLFRVDDSDLYVLVNRGWLRANPDRRILPDVTAPETSRTLVGQLNRFPVPGIRLNATNPDARTGFGDSPDDSPARLLFPTRDELASTLDVKLPDYQLQLLPDEPDGYLRDWRVVESGPEKHLGYAMQWFSFAALTCLFYAILMRLWLRSRRTASAL